MDPDQTNKSHRKKHSGPKAKRKFQKNLDPTSNGNEKRNPKAFAIQSVNKAARLFRRGKDIETKKQHVPKIETCGTDPPPLIVSVIGPPKVGKSTLIRCLVKSFTRQNITDIRGPITIIAGKKRRITFIECNKDMNCMIDLAKTSDLALLLIDASFGFEMEIFEFINICQVHGFPKIMGVLTHLDSFKHVSTLRKAKKRLKQRFWTEVYPGAKLFYLSGLVKEDYQKVEVHNLGRFIMVMKVQSIEWRNTHPYILVDRVEDITDPHTVKSNVKTDRKVCFYGYVHGSHLKYSSDVHLIGVGDFTLDTISFLEDPCPLPDTIKKRSLNQKEKLIYAPMSGIGGLIYDKDAIYIELGGSHSHRKKEGVEEEKEESFVQELHSDINGTIPIENKIQDIELSMFSESAPIKSSQIISDFYDSKNDQTGTADPSNRVTKTEQTDLTRSDTVEKGDDEFFDKLNDELALARSSAKTMENGNVEYQDGLQIDAITSYDEMPEDDGSKRETLPSDNEGKSVISNIKWKVDMEHKADSEYWAGLHGDIGKGDVIYNDDIANIRKTLCGSNPPSHQQPKNGGSEELGFLFSVTRKSDLPGPDSLDGFDCSKLPTSNQHLKSPTDTAHPESNPVGLIDWGLPQNLALIKSRFLKIKDIIREEGDGPSHKPKSKLGTSYDSFDENFSDSDPEDEEDKPYDDGDDGDSDEGIGDQNLEGSAVSGESDQDQNDGVDPKPLKKKRKLESDDIKGKGGKKMKDILEKKKRLKARFDHGYDEDKSTFYDDLRHECDEQSQLNKSEFAELDEEIRVKYEGHRPGMYVRIEIEDIPAEFIINYDPTFPVIIGGVAPTECSNGYIQARIKKHRWFERILKTRDPLIMSCGWRRYQTMVVYSNEDHSGRNQMLKYTPQNLHCLANFYGPICPQNTGILGIQSLAEGVKNFRISMTGVILNLNKSLDIVKKLKLVGTPIKIFKKTAFVKGMFNTALEAAKFEGAAIKSVSGIRGQIKRALHNPVGAVRVTFEDQILLSDIVFLRTWTTVQVPKYYNPVCNLLLPLGDARQSWTGMRTVGQIRQGQKPPVKIDSLYKKINRPSPKDTPLVVPPQLEKSLPFAEKMKERAGVRFIKKRAKSNISTNTKIAVIEDANEGKINQLLKVAKFVHEQKKQKAMEAMKVRVDKHRKELSRVQDKRDAGAKRFKKRICRTLGLVKQNNA